MESFLYFIGLFFGFLLFIVGWKIRRISKNVMHISKPGTISKNVTGEARLQHDLAWRRYYKYCYVITRTC